MQRMQVGEVYMTLCMGLMSYLVILGKPGLRKRAKKVIDYVRKFLDEIFPILDGSWNDLSNIQIDKNELELTLNNKRQN